MALFLLLFSKYLKKSNKNIKNIPFFSGRTVGLVRSIIYGFKPEKSQ